MTETLTMESLARAIHEDQAKAYEAVHGKPPPIIIPPTKEGLPNTIMLPFDELKPSNQAIRREQARLMLERWMR